MEAFIDIVSVIFNNTYFQFGEGVYKQTHGTPMGGKVSPIIALYVMDEVVTSIIS